VYFLGSPDGTRIKIGWSSKDVWERLQDHAEGDAFGQGGDYEILATVRATRHAESALKTYFRPYLKAKREVFEAEPLLPYITWLRDNYFVSLTETEFNSPSGRTVIDAQAWLPASGRTSTRRSEHSLFQTLSPWAILPSRVTTGDDWYTPPHIVTCIREALGGTIDLDPASHVMANEVIRATRFFTRDQNGLTQPWSGRVYLNPPFSSWPDWVEKVLAEADTVEAMVLLGAARTLTAQYFEPLLRRVDAFCIISGRTPFWGIATESDSPTDGHFLLYLGADVQRFVRATGSLGAVWVTPPIAMREVA
jgi:DNA N-6-adenine-methyltransferase (Dam)